MTLKANLYGKTLIVHQELCKDISLLLIGCSKAVLIPLKEPSYTYMMTHVCFIIRQ